MKALTLWRPWSDAIVAGAKPIENRTWAPPRGLLGQWIAIHGGKRWDEDGARWIIEEELWEPHPDAVSPQGIVGAAQLIGVVEFRTRPSDRLLVNAWWGDRDAAQARLESAAPWFTGPIGWLFGDAVSIDPVPCRGAQGLWTLPPDVDATVKQRMLRVLEDRA